MSEPLLAERGVPRWTRRFVYGFLGLLLLCGVVGIEAWPFSGFKLFSALRDDERESWQIVRVDPQGEESTVVLHDLPVGYRNTTKILPGFDDMTPEERDEVCDAWAKPYEDQGQPVGFLRIYRKTSTLGSGGPPPSRELMWECGL